MDYDSSPLLDVPKAVSELSILRLILITFLQLGLNVVQNSFNVITLPYEIKELFPGRPALTLGIVVATASAFMMMSPVVGYYSDRCTSRWGRRRPFCAVGGVLIIVGVVGCWFSSCSTFSLKYPYVVSYIVFHIGAVISNSGFTALLADVVPIQQRGVASGVYGVMGIVGASIGFAAVGAALPLDKTSLSYPVLIVVVVLSTCVTLFACQEIPLTFAQRTTIEEETPDIRSAIKQMLGGLKHRDFTLVLLSRLCYFIALSPQAFLLYLTDDLIPSIKNPELAVTILVISAQFVALLVTMPVGKLCDRFGRKIFVYIGTLLIIVVFELFVLTSSVYIFYGLGVLCGLGIGMYSTVEMALGMDCLPDDEKITQPESEESDQTSQSAAAGRNMGLWGTAQSAGSLIGMYMFSPLLQFVGGTGEKDHYTRTGYIVVYSLASMFAGLSAVLVFLIKTKRASSPAVQ